MSALETTLEWPRFCYTGPSLFEDQRVVKKGSRRKASSASQQKSPSSGNKRLSSGSTNTLESSDGESGSVKDEQMVPNNEIRAEFAFSDLMRKMASKYNSSSSSSAEPDADCKQQQQPGLRNSFSDAFSAALTHYFPYGAPFLPPMLLPPGFPALHPHHAPGTPLDALAGSRALSALAQKRLRPEEPEVSQKRAKVDDFALDLSCTTEDEVDILSIDPPSPSNVEQWSVDKVAEFVSNVESCREYAQVFLEHCIDGSALLVLTESHMTRILGLKLGPSIRLKSAIQELKCITRFD